MGVNGLVNEDTQVIKALDHIFEERDVETLAPSKKSVVIPVDSKSDGMISKTSNAVPEKTFDAVIAYARKKMEEFGAGIMNGSCEKNPYQLAERTACDYCNFKGVCGFDLKNEQDQYRILPTLKKEEIFEKIEGGEQIEMDKGTTTSD